MGVVIRPEETLVSELEQLRRMIVACGGIQRRKDGEESRGLKSKPIDDAEEKIVCVTSGVSFLGSAIVNELLIRGYSVRVIVDNPEDVNKLEETMNSRHNMITVVAAKLSDVNSLVAAFNGCRGVFHTSSSIDPAGLSGYTKIMSEVEMRTTENVMEACARTESVRNCVLTSSLLACIWRDQAGENETESGTSPIVNHGCWSSLQLCQNKKLWYALGKLKSEKAAWKIAQEYGLKLATICSALITGPNFHRRNSTPTIAYLKGAREMYANGLLATVELSKLANAHVCVYEGMKENASGRYICFDRVISTADEAEKLAAEIGVPVGTIVQTTPPADSPIPFQLSDKKLSDLMSKSNLQRSCLNENQLF